VKLRRLTNKFNSNKRSVEYRPVNILKKDGKEE